jgi:hypothetical protein
VLDLAARRCSIKELYQRWFTRRWLLSTIDLPAKESRQHAHGGG